MTEAHPELSPPERIVRWLAVALTLAGVVSAFVVLVTEGAGWRMIWGLVFLPLFVDAFADRRKPVPNLRARAGLRILVAVAAAVLVTIALRFLDGTAMSVLILATVLGAAAAIAVGDACVRHSRSRWCAPLGDDRTTTRPQ